MKGGKKEGGKGKVIDIVSQDKDWRGVISNELRCAEGWEKDWGFLADDTNNDRMLSKNEKIQALEEKIKKMENVKIVSVAKQSYQGGNLDIHISDNNKRKNLELQPLARRPEYMSKAAIHLKEKIGDDYKTKPYDNFLSGK